MTSHRSKVTLIEVTSERTDDGSLRNNIAMNSVTSKLTRRGEHSKDRCQGNKDNRRLVTRCGGVVVGCIVTAVVIITIIIIHSTSLVKIAPVDVLLKVRSVDEKCDQK